MQYVVSEQASSSVAMVHRCDCKRAQGLEKRQRDFRVHGPFLSGQQAMTAAVRTGKKMAKYCGCCGP